jgi:hypothetical protein
MVVGIAVLSGCVVATSSNGNGSSGGFFFLLLPLAFLVAAFAMARAGRRRRARRADVDEGGSGRVNPQLIRAELSVLADDVLRLEPQVALKEDARDDFDAATHRYRVAQAALDYTDAPVDLVRVQRVVDEATYSMSRARAILEERRPPEPPTTLRRPGPRGEPAIVLDDGERPAYEGSPASFRSGWFGGGGGLIGGLLLGSMMGGFGGWIVDEGGEDADLDGGTSNW